MVRALKATIVLLHMAVLFSAGLSFAGGAVLGYLAPLVIEPGERVQQAVEHVSLPGKLIEIRLGTAPSGVSLTTNEAGQLIIDWQTDETLADESLIQLLAKDLRSGEQVESRYLMVRRAVEINERAAEQKTVAQQTEVPVLQKAEAAVLPQIGPFEPQKLFVGMLGNGSLAPVSMTGPYELMCLACHLAQTSMSPNPVNIKSAGPRLAISSARGACACG